MGERYDRFERDGRVPGGREGVTGSSSGGGRPIRIRGKAGVGALGEAIVESRNSTSRASMLSMLLPSVKKTHVVLPDPESSLRLLTERFWRRLPKADSGSLLTGFLRGLPVLPEAKPLPLTSLTGVGV